MARRTGFNGSALVCGLMLAMGAGCDPAETVAAEELEVSCSGKCDGLSSVRNLMRDPSELSLDDLVTVAAPKVFEALSDAVSTDHVGVELQTPEFHDAAAVQGLKTGLAARYGERELSTEVNRVRAAHLADSDDTLYAEVELEIDGRLSDGWSMDVEGLTDAIASVGFGAGVSVQGRVITAVDFPADDPLRHVDAVRGFSIPRSAEDLREMKPGELVALRGEGRLGLNIGAGVPLLIAEPTGILTYNIVLTAALRSQLEGVLDIQLVKLEGGQLVLDVGIDKAKKKGARLAIEDRWGVQGLLEAEVEIAGIDVDLGKLVDKALQNQLNDKLDVISAHAERTETTTRTSVARFRLDVDVADPDLLEAALEQAVVGDIRLAQALANRGEPGIEAEFDLLRSGVSATSGAGIDVFGLSFFRERIESEGSVVVQAPGGARSLMFDSLHEEGGWFTSRHGYTRVGLSGLVFDPTGDVVASEANLFVQLAESDGAMERDKLVDHLDSIIVALGGEQAYAAIDAPANALEVLTQSLCPGAEIADSCTWESTQDPQLAPARAEALAAFSDAIAEQPQATYDLLMTVAEHKLLAQSTYEVKHNGYIGPGTDVFVDFRLDDATLSDLAFRNDGDDLVDALTEIVMATDAEREQSAEDIADDRKELRAEAREELAVLGEHFDAFAADYQRMVAAQDATVESIGAIGARALEVRFSIDQSNRPKYKDATARSIAQARAARVSQMFDDMLEDGGQFDPHEEQLVAYGLLALASVDHLDLRVDIDHMTKDTLATTRKVYRWAEYPEHVEAYARGPKTDPIDGGLFDIDALVDQ